MVNNKKTSRNLAFAIVILLIIALVLVGVFLAIFFCKKHKEKFNSVTNNKKIFILYTGGTIGMVKSPVGYVPKSGFLEEKLNQLVRIHGKDVIGNYTIKEYSPLLDSSNIGPQDWNRIAQDIHKVYNQYDAFIIISGTDTMAYISSALSFMLENLSKTVVITGSMISLQEPRNDGRNNLITSLIIASHYTIPEVVLVFDNLIIRGCRATKVNANSVHGFASPNYPPLGVAGVHIEMDWEKVRKPQGPFQLKPFDIRLKIAVIKLFPGIDSTFIDSIVENNEIHGIVLETFGIGDAPTAKPFLNSLIKAKNKGIELVNVTQCLMGRVDERDYETGVRLLQLGVYNGLDMTTEAAIAKLYYLLTWSKAREETKKLVSKNMRGGLVETMSTLYLQTGMFL